MKLLMIATGYLPYMFSENLCNGKLVLALTRAGHHVDVISRVDEGPTYGSEWRHPWTELQDSAQLITYPAGNPLVRAFDVARSSLKMGHSRKGIRWVRRAYEAACHLLDQGGYDAVLTRSPNDAAHLVGLKLKKKYGIHWIANWNDPAAPIWPQPYTHHFTPSQQKKEMQLTAEILHAADINTFPSDSLRNHFTANFPELRSMRTAVVPHIGLVDNVYDELRGKCPTGEKLMMLHSGNLSPERNPENTFRAMRSLLDSGTDAFELHIMGHVNDFTADMIERYGLAGHVQCIGSFDYFEAFRRMHTYDVLVLLEAILDRGIFFASKFTDYAQTGKPILAISPAEGFARDMLAAHGGGVHADNTSPEAIAQALSTLIRLKKEGRLSSISSSALYSNFAPATVVATYENLCSK